MIRTHISVTVGLTHNLGDYSNTRPEVQLSAQLLPQDNAGQCVMQLQDDAFDACCRQVDTVLERYGSPAKFSCEPRYSAYVSENEHLVIFVAAKRLDDPDYQKRFTPYNSWHSGHRYAALQRLMHAKFSPDVWHYLDEDEGGLDSVPKLERITTYEGETCVIVVRQPYSTPVPEYIRQHTHCKHRGYVNPNRFMPDLGAEFQGQKFIFTYFGTDNDIEELEYITEFQELRQRLAEESPTQPDPEADDDYDDNFPDDYDEEE